MKFLLDTNVVSEAILPQPRPGVLRNIQRHAGEIAIASVAWHELRFGIERLRPSHRRDDLETYLAEISVGMPMLDYNRAAAEWHARERARLVARGRTPPILDGQIAAIAAVNGLILVTFNVVDFQRFEGLRIESWS